MEEPNILTIAVDSKQLHPRRSNSKTIKRVPFIVTSDQNSTDGINLINGVGFIVVTGDRISPKIR